MYSFFHETVEENPSNPGRPIRRQSIKKTKEDTALRREFHMIDSVDRMITQLKSSKYDSITIFYDNDYAYKITWRDGENFTATTIPYA